MSAAEPTRPSADYANDPGERGTESRQLGSRSQETGAISQRNPPLLLALTFIRYFTLHLSEGSVGQLPKKNKTKQEAKTNLSTNGLYKNHIWIVFIETQFKI